MQGAKFMSAIIPRSPGAIRALIYILGISVITLAAATGGSLSC
jgi:hypothetical protein